MNTNQSDKLNFLSSPITSSQYTHILTPNGRLVFGYYRDDHTFIIVDYVPETLLDKIKSEAIHEYHKDWGSPVQNGSASCKPNPQSTKAKSDTVHITRYFRPRDPITYEIDNMKGITAIFSINYRTKTFQCQWSVCNGDNFSKEDGRTVALFNGQMLNRIIRGDYNREQTLFENLFRELKVQNNHIVPTTSEKILLKMMTQIGDDYITQRKVSRPVQVGPRFRQPPTYEHQPNTPSWFGQILSKEHKTKYV